MGALSNLYATTIGKKVVMALSGVVLFGFAIGHMAGNLLVFVSEEALNGYAYTLKSTPLLLWGTRLTLLAAFPVHIITAIQLTRMNAKARPTAGGKTTTAPARTPAARCGTAGSSSCSSFSTTSATTRCSSSTLRTVT